MFQWQEKAGFVLFWGEISPLCLYSCYAFIFYLLSWFPDGLTNINNFNYLLLKMFLKWNLYYLLCCSKLVTQDQLLPALGMPRVSRYATHLDLKFSDYRSESSCHQGFTCFVFFQLIFHLNSISIFLLERVEIHCNSNFYWQK